MTKPIRRNRVSHDRKLSELILFISKRSEGDLRFGAVKLNKLLFYADFFAYLLFGNPITGQEYQKLVNGPAPRRLLPVRQELVDRGSLAIRKVEFFSKTQDRTFALREPDVSIFSPEEIALVTEIIHDNWNRNASEISHLSHQFHGWEDARIKEAIPYEIALLSSREPSEAERRHCLKDSPRAAAILSGDRKVRPLHA